MADILVLPPELRKNADQLRSSAKNFGNALDAIDKVLLSLKGEAFLGNRASAVQSHYASKRDALHNARNIVLHFADDLHQAADKFEKADKEGATGNDKQTDLRTTIKNDPKNKEQAIIDYITQNSSKGTSEILKHGMTNTEKMTSFTFEGITFYYTGKVDKSSAIVKTLLNFTGAAKMPDSLLGSTKEVIISSQKNSADSYWEKTYNMKGFTSLATGGDGSIVVYNNSAMDVGSLAHEMGHNFAKDKWGSTVPGKDSDFSAAINSKESAPTFYATRAPAEDFAESVKLYITDPDQLKKIAPKRFEIVEKLLEEKDYHG